MFRITFVLTLLLVIAAVPVFSAGATVGGRVIDEDGHGIANVTIRSRDLALPTQSDADGGFLLTLTEPRTTTLSFSRAGYIPRSVAATPGDSDLEVTLATQVYPMQGLTVTTGRAIAGRTPVSFEDIDRETIERDFDIGEVPAFLESTPNLYSYSDAGGGLGYSYLSIRGFNARRAPVYINGIPLNDPEDHALYFVDLPDFASYADNIQVQRGVGNSLYGDASFGGSVNILTSVLSHTRKAVIETGYGGFLQGSRTVGLIRKSSVLYSTGLLDNGWSLVGRWVTQFSDGYRENSWYDGTAYYLSVGRIDPDMITTVNIYGGPMNSHAAWDGIDRETMKVNRRANWYTYSNETDNFNQPHFEIHNIYNLSERVTLNSSLYHIRGEGFYEQFKDGEDLHEYNLADLPGQESNLVRRKWVRKGQWGANSHLDYQSDVRQAVFGASYYFFESEHWGEVTWAEALSPSHLSLESPFRYYEYFGKYHNMSVFGSYRQDIGERLSLSATMQLRYLNKDIHLTPIGIYDATMYGLNWLFLSPRIGLDFAVSDVVSSYVSFSIASHEPNDDMIDDADDPHDTPNLEVIDAASDPVVYGDALVEAERVYDVELGMRYRVSGLSLEGNLFWMEYRNELVPDGSLNDDGFPTYGNADRSVHRGIELSSVWQALPNLRLEGNYAYNDNWIKTYDQNVYDWGSGAVTVVAHRDVATPNFPRYLGNLAVDVTFGKFQGVYRLRAVGRQFVSLDGRFVDIDGVSHDVSIEPYTTSSLKGILRLGDFIGGADLTLEARVDNLFDMKYETFGYRWGDYFAYWPAAERNWFVNFKLAF